MKKLAKIKIVVLLLGAIVFSFFFIFSCNISQHEQFKSSNPFAYIGKLHNEGLDYVFNFIKDNKDIAISRRESGKHDFYAMGCAGAYAFMQGKNLISESEAYTRTPRNISGVVTDVETGEPIFGATILVAGTTIGTMTDVSGSYMINAIPPDAVLILKYFGYHMKLLPVANRTVLNVELMPDPHWEGEDIYYSPSTPVYLPAEEVGFVTEQTIYCYDRLMAIFHDETIDQQQFNNKITLLEGDILADTLIPQEEKNTLLCGTTTAIASVEYWIENVDNWVAELDGGDNMEKTRFDFPKGVIFGGVTVGDEPLPGCTVSVKGTTIATTDMDG